MSNKKTAIGVNTKYYTKSQISKNVSHNFRMLPDEDNLIKPLAWDKLSGVGIITTSAEEWSNNYNEAIDLMGEKKGAKNQFVECVVSIPYDQFKEVQKNSGGIGNCIKEITNGLEDFMKKFENESGMMPIGYALHLDEGHYEKDHDGNDVPIYNTHAHVTFANVCRNDFTLKKDVRVIEKDENGKAMKDERGRWKVKRDENNKIVTEKHEEVLKRGRMPLSKLVQKGSQSIWSRQQDLAFESFKHLGFTRGVKGSKAKHEDAATYKLKKETERLEAENRAAKLINTIYEDWSDAAIKKDDVAIRKAQEDARKAFESKLLADIAIQVKQKEQLRLAERNLVRKQSHIKPEQTLTNAISRPKMRP